MSPRLWGVLHRPVDLVAYPGHAPREAGRSALRPVDRRQPVQAVRAAGTPGGVCRLAADRGDVWGVGRGGDGLPEPIGDSDEPIDLTNAL